MADATQRSALGSFLKARRALISPQSVGLPMGRGRRLVAGLRREEVATLAGVGVSWYTWLEQGRPIQPSAELLARIARALRLDPADEAYLHALGGQPSPDRLVPAFALTPELAGLLELYAGPALVVNGMSDMLAFNAMAARLYDIDALPAEVRNDELANTHLWQTFLNPDRRRLYRDYGRFSRHAVALFRLSSARHAREPRYLALVAALSRRSARFRTAWEQHETRAPLPFPVRMSHRDFGDIAMHAVRMPVDAAGDVYALFLVPADEATRAAFARSRR